MKLFHFETKEQHWETYIEFAVLADSKEQAWKMIRDKMAEPICPPEDTNSPMDWNEFIDDISQYDITEHKLNSPVVIPFFQAG